MRKITVPAGQLIEHRSFVVDYVGEDTDRLIEKVILDGRLEVEYRGDQRQKGLRTILVKNDVRPSIDSDTLNMTLKISLKTSRKVKIVLNGDYDVTINWGDGIVQTVTGEGEVHIEHTYLEDMVSRMAIEGTCDDLNVTSDALLLISSFGKLGLKKIDFNNCVNLIKLPESLPDTVRDMSYAFSRCNRLDTSVFSQWDFSHLETIEGFLSFCSDKHIVLKDTVFTSLTSLDRFFHSSLRCTLELENLTFEKLESLVGIFEAADEPNLYIRGSKFPRLKIVDALFNESYQQSDTRGKFSIEQTSFGLTEVRNLIYNCSGIDIDFIDLSFPQAVTVEQLAADVIDTDILINGITLPSDAQVTRLFSNVTASVSSIRSNLVVNGKTLASVTDYHKLFDNISNCDVRLNFFIIENEDTITNFSGMFFSLSDCDIDLGVLEVGDINLTGIIENSNRVKLAASLKIENAITIENLVSDSDEISIDLSGSVFKASVSYGTLAPGADTFSFTESSVNYHGDVTYLKLLSNHVTVSYFAIDNTYRSNVYIDGIVNGSGINEIYATNWQINGNLTLICLLRDAQLLNPLKEVSFNGWQIEGTVNKNTLMRYIDQPEGYAIPWIRNCIIETVSFRNWSVTGDLNLESVFRGLVGVNKLDFENWTVNYLNLNSAFKECGSSVSLRRWTFKENAVLSYTFADIDNYNRTIDLEGVFFLKEAALDSTFRNSNVNVSLLSVRFKGRTVLSSSFESFGSRIAPAGTEVLIKGLSSIDTSLFVVINRFMANLGRGLTVKGLEGLSMWSFDNSVHITDPFINAVIPIEPPF